MTPSLSFNLVSICWSTIPSCNGQSHSCRMCSIFLDDSHVQILPWPAIVVNLNLLLLLVVCMDEDPFPIFIALCDWYDVRAVCAAAWVKTLYLLHCPMMGMGQRVICVGLFCRVGPVDRQSWDIYGCLKFLVAGPLYPPCAYIALVNSIALLPSNGIHKWSEQCSHHCWTYLTFLGKYL